MNQREKFLVGAVGLPSPTRMLAATAMMTVARLLSVVPSFALKVKLSFPAKPELGV